MHIELDKVLNLNMQTLVVNRREVLKIVIYNLKIKYPKSTWTAAILNKEIQKWNEKKGDGKYRPYCQIVIHHLKKKLRSIPNV